jgi:hypothetical protein
LLTVYHPVAADSYHDQGDWLAVLSTVDIPVHWCSHIALAEVQEDSLLDSTSMEGMEGLESAGSASGQLLRGVACSGKTS